VDGVSHGVGEKPPGVDADVLAELA